MIHGQNGILDIHLGGYPRYSALSKNGRPQEAKSSGHPILGLEKGRPVTPDESTPSFDYLSKDRLYGGMVQLEWLVFFFGRNFSIRVRQRTVLYRSRKDSPLLDKRAVN